jgi:RNA polymerase sigma-70 factor
MKDKNKQARAVFEILVRENEAMLMTYLRAAVSNESAAEDLFQETMLTAWKKLGEFDRSRPFGPWLRGISGRLTMAYYRKAKRSFIPGTDEMLEYLSRQIEHISERPGDTWAEKIEALKQCIEALPEHYREPIHLRYFENRPTTQIAEMSKVSLEGVKKRLQRARSKLLDCLHRKKLLTEAVS